MKDLVYRTAKADDLTGIIELLYDDQLGSTREAKHIDNNNAYSNAFQVIQNDSNQEPTVVLSGNEIVATFQLSFIQYLTYQGGLRAQIEGVRVASGWRGKGIGHHIFEYAINRAKEKGCHLVQLTTDKRRPEAIRFYKSLGFKASHEGMKLWI